MIKEKLVWKDDSTRVVLKSTVIAHFAMYAIRQSPYLYPEELLKGIDEFNEVFTPDGDTIGGEQFIDTTCSALEKMVCNAISKCATIASWNMPTNNKDKHGKWVFVDRYTTPDPDSDFIDLHALARNVAHSVWLEVCYDDGWFE